MECDKSSPDEVLEEGGSSSNVASDPQLQGTKFALHISKVALDQVQYSFQLPASVDRRNLAPTGT